VAHDQILVGLFDGRIEFPRQSNYLFFSTTNNKTAANNGDSDSINNNTKKTHTYILRPASGDFSTMVLDEQSRGARREETRDMRPKMLLTCFELEWVSSTVQLPGTRHPGASSLFMSKWNKNFHSNSLSCISIE
jgi:hypothetical protein